VATIDKVNTNLERAGFVMSQYIDIAEANPRPLSQFERLLCIRVRGLSGIRSLFVRGRLNAGGMRVAEEPNESSNLYQKASFADSTEKVALKILKVASSLALSLFLLVLGLWQIQD
jgi:hypothetical protein